MLKTIIIDDEELIREGLKTTIPWDNLGFEVVGIAADGEEAIEVIQAKKPDVIITDIRMPFMTGLELVEFIKPIVPDAYIVILSGHDEFQYAQKALQLGVYDFILKPFDFDYFIKILKKIKYEHTLKKSSQIQVIPEEDLQHLQNEFIRSVILGKLQEGDIAQKLTDYQMEVLDNKAFVVIKVLIDNYHLLIAEDTFEHINNLNKAYFQAIAQLLKDKPLSYLIEGTSGDATLIIFDELDQSVDLLRQQLTRKIRQQTAKIGNESITIAYSKTQKNIGHLAKAYNQAVKASDQRYISGYNQDIPYERGVGQDSVTSDMANFSQIGFDYQQFTELLIRKDASESTDYINEVYDKILTDGHNSLLYLSMFSTSVYTAILSVLHSKSLSIGDLFDNPLSLYKKITLPGNLFDHREIMLELVQKTANYIHTKVNKNCDKRISEAKDYIHDHYNSYELTLQQVAEAVNMGVCYFSSMFKKEMGDSFINYLTAIRIEAAKKLFETTDLRTYEISYQVGYNTPTYFSTIFKRQTGFSPSNYRKQIK